MAKVFTKEENQAWSKKLPGKMTSACLVIRCLGKALMVKAAYKDHWTFPSGIVDDKESPKDAALRETKEETGIEFKSVDCKLLTIIYTASTGDDRDRFNFAFSVAVADTNINLSVPNDEIEKAEWVDIKDVAERSGNKGSYREFQKILLDPTIAKPYVEVR